MKYIQCTVVIVIACSVINWIRRDADIAALTGVLPMMDGEPVNALYAAAGVAMLLIFAWGLGRLYRAPGETDELDDERDSDDVDDEADDFDDDEPDTDDNDDDDDDDRDEYDTDDEE